MTLLELERVIDATVLKEVEHRSRIVAERWNALKAAHAHHGTLLSSQMIHAAHKLIVNEYELRAAKVMDLWLQALAKAKLALTTEAKEMIAAKARLTLERHSVDLQQRYEGLQSMQLPFDFPNLHEDRERVLTGLMVDLDYLSIGLDEPQRPPVATVVMLLDDLRGLEAEIETALDLLESDQNLERWKKHAVSSIAEFNHTESIALQKLKPGYYEMGAPQNNLLEELALYRGFLNSLLSILKTHPERILEDRSTHQGVGAPPNAQALEAGAAAGDKQNEPPIVSQVGGRPGYLKKHWKGSAAATLVAVLGAFEIISKIVGVPSTLGSLYCSTIGRVECEERRIERLSLGYSAEAFESIIGTPPREVDLGELHRHTFLAPNYVVQTFTRKGGAGVIGYSVTTRSPRFNPDVSDVKLGVTTFERAAELIVQPPEDTYQYPYVGGFQYCENYQFGRDRAYQVYAYCINSVGYTTDDEGYEALLNRMRFMDRPEPPRRPINFSDPDQNAFRRQTAINGVSILADDLSEEEFELIAPGPVRLDVPNA